jgi:hypothetical protein
MCDSPDGPNPTQSGVDCPHQHRRRSAVSAVWAPSEARAPASPAAVRSVARPATCMAAPPDQPHARRLPARAQPRARNATSLVHYTSARYHRLPALGRHPSRPRVPRSPPTPPASPTPAPAQPHGRPQPRTPPAAARGGGQPPSHSISALPTTTTGGAPTPTPPARPPPARPHARRPHVRRPHAPSIPIANHPACARCSSTKSKGSS